MREESREEQLYRSRHDDQNLEVALHMARQIEEAYTEFSAFVSSCDRVDERYEQQVHHDSLWWYFDVWLSHLYNSDFRSGSSRWRHFNGKTLTFDQFRNLIPALYLKIGTEYLRDPSRLDFVRRGSWRHGRLRTRLAIQLIWLLFTLVKEPWGSWPQIHAYLHTKIAVEGYPGRIPRRVTSLLPQFATPDDGIYAQREVNDAAPTTQEITRGEVLALICGALSHWPVRTYDSAMDDLIM
ncbi:hypothetical protein [Nocardia aurea]|uniref:Uncharacterized protein n=1 Tax=Nocardia aurea TaxID=2144174 RepID=A0ABV3FQD1_9NOCA